ncbi:hypothetical protein MVEN_02621700 [Mycena venus]|uniref:DUF4048 domain-containing protein n=1 Tax=Mycena venus TaxID=2733690 RepID=A0A8H6WPR7_9AGAR|nr:hypothetical protein MVEN_02621700 [Mycena venus]
MPIGPRPLQLANGPVSEAPLSAVSVSAFSPSPLSPSTPTTPNGGPRRQSSITYNPATRPPRAGHRSTLQRSNSVGGSLDMRKSMPERSPVTLAEKHADLLHFIAQKESKCLELRSQLAMHEAELLQLKRKWERIVSRGFTSPHNVSTPTTSTSSSFPSTSTSAASLSSFGTSVSGSSLENATSANGGAVLDGIREGVQGVGRFIAALSPTAAAHSHSYFESVISPRPNGRYRRASPNRRNRPSAPQRIPARRRKRGEEDGAQVLMVHDTGATPTMSPNPAFRARQQQRERQPTGGTTGTGDSSAEAEEEFFFAQAQAASFVPAKSPTKSFTPPQSQTPTPPPTAKRSAVHHGGSLGAAGLAPLVDGVGLNAPAATVSAWVGTVGKKWGELQKVPTVAKNTKRASLLFSDIAYALQVGPSPSSQSPSPSPSPAPSPAMTTSSTPTTSTSLLDDDDGAMAMPDAPALTPTSAPMLTPVRKSSLRTRQQQPQSPLSLSKSKIPPKPNPPAQQAQKPDDDDDEWNW